MLTISQLLLFINIALSVAIIGSWFAWQDKLSVTHSLSHASVSSVAIGNIFNINYMAISSIVASIFTFMIYAGRRYLFVTYNTIIAVSGNILMAIGVFIDMIFMKGSGVTSYIIGDIFFIKNEDIYWLSIINIIFSFMFYRKYNNIILGIIYKSNSSRILTILSYVQVIYISKILGIFASSIILTIVPYSMHHLSRSPIFMILYTCISVIILTLLSYYLTIYFDFYFCSVLTVLSILFSILIFILNKLCIKF